MNSKPFKHFDKLSTFNSKKISAISDDTAYYNNNIAVVGEPDISWNDICFIEDEKLIWTHGEFYNDGSNTELDDKITEIEEQLDGIQNIYAATVATIMDQMESAVSNEDIETLDKVLSYSLSEQRDALNTLDTVVSYSLTEHEKRLDEQEYTIGFALNDLHNDIVTLDTTVSYALTEHENELNTLDKTVSYALTDHEEKIEGTSNMLIVNTSIIMDMFNDLSDLTPEEINYILE